MTSPTTGNSTPLSLSRLGLSRLRSPKLDRREPAPDPPRPLRPDGRRAGAPARRVVAGRRLDRPPGAWRGVGQGVPLPRMRSGDRAGHPARRGLARRRRPDARPPRPGRAQALAPSLLGAPPAPRPRRPATRSPVTTTSEHLEAYNAPRGTSDSEGLVYLFDLTGKVAVVSGGTRGIGMMMARGLLQAGAAVYISSRKPEAGEAAAKELSQYGTVISVPADLSREEECLRLAEEVGRNEEGVNVLVNNAGANWGAPLEEVPAHGWDKVVDLNLKTPFYLTRTFLPLLDAAGTADDPARVINVGSIDGLRVPYEYPTYSYSASKAGLHQLTRVLARELGPRHITVNAVAPGPFESKMMAATLAARGDQIAAANPLGRIGRPDDMAGVAVFLSGRGSAYITGAIIPVDGGIWAAS